MFIRLKAMLEMPLRASGICHRVMNPAINRRATILILGNGDLGGDGGRGAEAVSHLEGDCVDAPVAAAIAFRSQFYRLAITRDDDVIAGIAISITVFHFIARDLIDHHAVEVNSTVATAGTGDQVGNIYRVVTVVWWPQLDVVSVENYSRRRRVHSQISALTGCVAGAGCFHGEGAGITSLNVRDCQGAGGSGAGNCYATAEAAGGQHCDTFLPNKGEGTSAAGRRRKAGG